MKKQVLIIYFAYRDPRIGLLPRALVFIAIAYALSPIDLIPDFIPIFGLLDDIVILPAIIALAIKLIPPEVIIAARQKAEEESPDLKRSWIFVPVIITIWILSGILVAYWIFRILRT